MQFYLQTRIMEANIREKLETASNSWTSEIEIGKYIYTNKSEWIYQ